jgi:hypothetical protein
MEGMFVVLIPKKLENYTNKINVFWLAFAEELETQRHFLLLHISFPPS